MKKKLLALMLVIAMVLQPGIDAKAQEDTSLENVMEAAGNQDEEVSAQSNTNQLTNAEQKIYYYMTDNWMRIDLLPDYCLTEDEVSAAMSRIFAYDPALELTYRNLDMFNYNCQMETVTVDGEQKECVETIVFTHQVYSDEEFQKIYEKNKADIAKYGNSTESLDKEVEKALSCVSGNMSDTEKVIAIHDYLAETVTYDYDHYKNHTIPATAYTAYGALVLKSCVCCGYAEAMKLLMDKVGIPCVKVTSSKMNHAWNMVQLDGEWYHVDVTWDDPVGNAEGVAERKYLLRNDAEMKRLDHYDWSNMDSIVSNATTYTNMPRNYNDKQVLCGHNWVVYSGNKDAVVKDITGKDITTIHAGTVIKYHRGANWLIYGMNQTIKRWDCLQNKEIDVYTLSEQEKGTAYPEKAKVTDITSYETESGNIGYQYTAYNQNNQQETKSGTCPLDATYVLDKIMFKSTQTALSVGETYKLQVEYDPYYATGSRTVAWSSDAPGVAAVDSNGVVTATSVGSAVIKAKSGGKECSCKVVVTNPITAITFPQNTYEIEVGQSADIAINVTPADSSEEVMWMSIYEQVVSVNQNGRVTGLQEGETTVVAMVGNIMAKCTVRVIPTSHTPVPVEKITLNQAEVQIYSGENLQLTAAITPEDAENKEVIWSSEDEDIAEVDGNGLVLAHSPGTVNVTATTADGGKSAQCRITVMNQETGQLPFTDVHLDNWYYNSVEYVYRNGIMTGLTQTRFGPAEKLARAQFSTILYRMEGAPDVSYSAEFPDVAEGQFYTSAVMWASEAGVVSGYANGRFGPADNITREQMAVMMFRYAKYKEYDISASDDLSGFPDSESVSAFSREAMEWAVGAGLISGSQGMLVPQGSANRAECATIIMRFMEYYK